MMTNTYSTPEAHALAERRAWRGTRWRMFGIFLNNLSLALGLGLVLYYFLRWGGWDSFLPQLSDEQVRYYALTTVAVALGLNLVSYVPISYGKALEGGKPGGEFDFTQWKAEKAVREALEEKAEREALEAAGLAPSVDPDGGKRDRRPAPQNYPSFSEPEVRVEDLGENETSTEKVAEVDQNDEAISDLETTQALAVWDDEAPGFFSPSVESPEPLNKVDGPDPTEDEALTVREEGDSEEGVEDETNEEQADSSASPLEEEHKPATVEDAKAAVDDEVAEAQARLDALRARLAGLEKKDS